MSLVARVWLSVFAIWSLLLSGALASVVGSPGALQLWRLHGLLDSKRAGVTRLTDEIRAMQLEAGALEKNRVVQHREIRRVLGYAAPDEIIFDFASPSIH